MVCKISNVRLARAEQFTKEEQEKWKLGTEGRVVIEIWQHEDGCVCPK